MKKPMNIRFLELSSRRVADLQGDKLSIDDACDFIRNAADTNVLPWKAEKVTHILSTGRAYGLATDTAIYASAFSASLNADSTGPTEMIYPDTCSGGPDDQEVGGILTAECMRGARIVYGTGDGVSEMSLSRGFVAFVVSHALYDLMGVPGFTVNDPLPLTYNTMDTAETSRAIGYKLGFRAPHECRSAQQYAQRSGYQTAFRDRSKALGHGQFQLAYLQAASASGVVADTLAILDSKTVYIRVGDVHHKLSISESVFPKVTVDLLWELLERLEDKNG